MARIAFAWELGGEFGHIAFVQFRDAVFAQPSQLVGRNAKLSHESQPITGILCGVLLYQRLLAVPD